MRDMALMDTSPLLQNARSSYQILVHGRTPREELSRYQFKASLLCFFLRGVKKETGEKDIILRGKHTFRVCVAIIRC
ncbi:hypothetical protein DPMN_016261 [Dreissena polymorpha]|uniref:Uncharacterized protein n=1 Tax=Dreissena polymorpha TaxID=45954 RepID=A0A9D4NE83_DREPO|nr:hypothetical protein DPMN_016261 [Dreissena polymorpha]